MSDPSFVCATCGKTHKGLPTDFGFRLPDEVHALGYTERYLRSRSNADLCTLDEGRYFIRGILPVPLAESDEEFCWGVWVELNKVEHDSYVEGFQKDLSNFPRFIGRIANDVPGYAPTSGLEVEVQFQEEGARPFFYFPKEAAHALALEHVNGITSKRHHDLLEATGFFDEE